MLVRTAFLLTLVYALGQPLSANAQDAGRCQHHAQDQQLALVDVCPTDAQRTRHPVVILLPSVDDITAGRGPAVNGQILRQIAIYQSVGNRDGAEILTNRLRTSGVSNESVDEAVTWANVHSSAPNSLTAAPLDPGSQATQ
jgi:hypothetical protein